MNDCNHRWSEWYRTSHKSFSSFEYDPDSKPSLCDPCNVFGIIAMYKTKLPKFYYVDVRLCHYCMQPEARITNESMMHQNYEDKEAYGFNNV